MVEGTSKTRLYVIYHGMKQRCLNAKSPEYKWYGGKGISICSEWLDKDTGLQAFIGWALDNGYNESLTIDRINSNEGYSPANCRWVTLSENSKSAHPRVQRIGGQYYTEAQKKASIKYMAEKTDDIRLRVPKGTKERYKKAAEARGMSMTQFILAAVEKEIGSGQE